KQVPEQVKVQVPVYVANGLLLERQQNKEETDKMIAKAMLQERGKLQTGISSQIQNAIDTNIPSLVDAFVRSYMSGHILHVHPAQTQTTSIPEQQYQLYLSMKDDPQTPVVRPRDQDDPHDDAHPEGENSTKWQKTSEYEAHVTRESSGQVNEKEQGDEHQYYIDQMKNFLKSDIRDPEALALSLINQDLLYLKKGISGPEKIVLSLHKFHAIIFNNVDIEERTSRWVNKQKEPGKPKEVVYSNSKIIHVIKTYWELSHEHKFITEIVARRANECIVSIIESDYKNLNKNDIEDMYLLIMHGKVPDYAETGIEKHKMFSIIYEPVHRIIYKNSKKEKRVMRYLEIHKFCDATLNRVLEGLKSYNNDVKYGYIQRDLIKDEVEYLKLFKEEIKVRLKYRNQMRKWETYVNGRPFGPRRERLE
ncbi:hypothetical protein Tco_1033095, partial [Tanacetum coccineum]